MDEQTKTKLTAFAEKFRAQRRDAETRKLESKKASADLAERKQINRRFHLVNVNPEKGTPLQRGEADTRIELLRKEDEKNWQALSVLVTGQWQVCRCCGHEAIATSGFYFREKHKTIPSAKRLRAINYLPEGFEVEVAIEGVVLERCVKCLEGNLVDDILSLMLHDGQPNLQLSNQMELFKG